MHFGKNSAFPDRVIQFGESFEVQLKESLPQKAIHVFRSRRCFDRESTGSKLQDDPDLISVACSYTDLSISVRFGR